MIESDALLTILAINQGNTGGEVGHLVEGICRPKLCSLAAPLLT